MDQSDYAFIQRAINDCPGSFRLMQCSRLAMLANRIDEEDCTEVLIGLGLRSKSFCNQDTSSWGAATDRSDSRWVWYLTISSIARRLPPRSHATTHGLRGIIGGGDDRMSLAAAYFTASAVLRAPSCEPRFVNPAWPHASLVLAQTLVIAKEPSTAPRVRSPLSDDLRLPVPCIQRGRSVDRPSKLNTSTLRYYWKRIAPRRKF